MKNAEGRYVADAATLAELEDAGRVVFRYCSPEGATEGATGEAHNPNGASNAIAGLRNEAGNVVGLMPHPEHAIEDLCGPGTDGLGFFSSAIAALQRA